MSQTKLRKNIINWARRRHFDILGPLRDNDKHQNYLSMCDTLEHLADLDIWDSDENSLEDAWGIVLEGLNSIPEEKLVQLEKFRH